MSVVTESKGIASRIEGAIDKSIVGGITLTPKGGLQIKSMGEAMEFAKLMSLMGQGLPKHCRDTPGICVLIAIQSYEWGMNPLAVAAKSYVVNDRLAYESALYHSVVVRRAPIDGRIKMEFTGDGVKRRCKVSAELSDGTGVVDYLSPEIGTIKTKNSPLWAADPDQQLFYYSVRAFARRHFPDVMMGVYTVDELQDSSEALTAVVQDTRPKTDRLADRLLGTAKPVVDEPESQAEVDDAPSPTVATMFLNAVADATKPSDLDEIFDGVREHMDTIGMSQDEYESIKSAIEAKRVTLK